MSRPAAENQCLEGDDPVVILARLAGALVARGVLARNVSPCLVLDFEAVEPA
jgi:hypothetical protein